MENIPSPFSKAQASTRVEIEALENLLAATKSLETPDTDESDRDSYFDERLRTKDRLEASLSTAMTNLGKAQSLDELQRIKDYLALIRSELEGMQ